MILKRTDIALLRAAEKSNGGGVDELQFPEAPVRRLLKSGNVYLRKADGWGLDEAAVDGWQL